MVRLSPRKKCQLTFLTCMHSHWCFVQHHILLKSCEEEGIGVVVNNCLLQVSQEMKLPPPLPPPLPSVAAAVHQLFPPPSSVIFCPSCPLLLPSITNPNQTRRNHVLDTDLVYCLAGWHGLTHARPPATCAWLDGTVNNCVPSEGDKIWYN